MATNAAFLVTVDTEASAWDQAEANSIANVQYLPVLQRIFNRYGIRPTYLVTYEMATRAEAIRVLKPIQDSGRCEIGLHFHVWSTPPLEQPTRTGIDAAWVHGLQSELPDDLFYEKIATLRKAITASYGRPPTSHRAGRWAVDHRTLRWLKGNGFLVDTSMTPGISWAQLKGVRGTYNIDTSQIPDRPFVQSLDTPFRAGRIGRDGLLEVPVTAATVPAPRVVGWLVSRIPRRIRRSLRGQRLLFRARLPQVEATPCRPYPWIPAPYLRRLAEVAVARSGVVNMMFHSSEIMLGGSPYSRTPEMHAAVMANIESLCAWSQPRLRPLTLSEFAARLTAAA